VPRRQGEAARAGIADVDVAEPAFRRDAPQIDLEQGGPVRRVGCVLEGRETLLHDERRQAQETELVRRRDHDPAAGAGDAAQLAAERARVLQVLDRFHRGHHVGRRTGERERKAIEICLQEVDVSGEPRVTDGVCSDAAREHGLNFAPELPCSATEIGQDT
jgi:phage tail tape-measure protein